MAATRATLARLAQMWGRPEFMDPAAEDDLFSHLDSFAIVELLMETESEIERAVGRYVPLASESILDAEKSPLLRFQGWTDYVAGMVAHG
ncbi:hypothetical protein FV228_01995 [Methylobacterium sp. WL18]|uniref:hypothetical protein n=1 Tax=Methylobacterium sp. WL18 TaxID=2603897 RepID=UPI0011C87A57|nr:hypothetical protein [Methylobacterium sp. WL18]TXN75950.1 hypothetical protein FV228_01995 [Methylobacterium sp. WL18]